MLNLLEVEGWAEGSHQEVLWQEMNSPRQRRSAQLRTDGSGRILIGS